MARYHISYSLKLIVAKPLPTFRTVCQLPRMSASFPLIYAICGTKPRNQLLQPLPSWPVALKLPGVRLGLVGYWKPCLCSPRTPPYRACAVPQPFSTPAVCGQHSSGKGTRPEGHAWGQELDTQALVSRRCVRFPVGSTSSMVPHVLQEVSRCVARSLNCSMNIQ